MDAEYSFGSEELIIGFTLIFTGIDNETKQVLFW